MIRSTLSPRLRRLAGFTAGVGLACLMALLAPAASPAQDPPRDEPGDVVFRTVNGTTGEDCVVERLLLQEHTMRLGELEDYEPTSAVFTFRDVPLVDARAYLATVWFEDVPYYWEFRGRFLDQDTNTVHVFDVTDGFEDVAVGGLSLVFKKGGELVTYEMLIEVDNQNRPQRTVTGRSLDVMLPAGATAVEATLHRGPEPVAARTTRTGDRLSIEAPLTPGKTRLQVRCRAEWRPGFEIPVECNLPIRAWSLMGSPDYLDYACFELEPDESKNLPGTARFVGRALEAGRSIVVRVDETAAPAEETEVFSQPGDAEPRDQPAAAQEKGGSRLPLSLLALAVVLIVLIVVVRRRS